MEETRIIDITDLYEVNLKWFVENYWNEIRWQIANGTIEAGRLDWDDVTSIMTVLDVLAAHCIGKFDIPDDIIGEFAERGYGEFIEQYKKNQEETQKSEEEA